MKKFLHIILAVLLVISAFAGCAKRTHLPEQTNAPAQSSKSANNQTVAPTSGGVPTNTSAAYAKLIAYKTKDYGQQSIADFNASLVPTSDELTEFLAAQADVINGISPDDENYDFFTTTMAFSAHELYCERMEEEFTFSIDLSKKSRPCSYLDEAGEPVYDFTCFVDANVAYSINDSKLITVAERDKAFLTFKEEMQNYLNGLSEAEITGGNIKKMLKDKSAELANSLSTDNMRLSPCEIYLLEISSYLLEITGEAEEAK